MKNLIPLLTLLLLSAPLYAQYVPTEQQVKSDPVHVQDIRFPDRNASTADRIFGEAKTCFITGGVLAAIGGAFIATPFIIDHYRDPLPPGEFREDMGSALMLVTGIAFTFTGAVTLVCGVPLLAAGHGVMNSDTYWKNQKFDDGQRGVGVIIDGAGFIPWAQIKVTPGYHFNRRWFVGAGFGIGMDFSEIGNPYVSMIDLPIYAEARYSALNGIYSPYAGASLGYDVLCESPYLGADLGVRIRMNPHTPSSLWVSVTGEVAGYMRLGVKLGWEF